MQLIRNTLEIEKETWDDPGDYPSAAGSGPMPSHDFVAAVDGEVVYSLEPQEVADYQEFRKDFLSEIAVDLPAGVLRCKFDSKLEGAILTLTPTDDFDAEAIEPDEPWDRWGDE